MRLLNTVEVHNVSGGTWDGAIVGMFDGAATGMSIGGKWGGAGGWGFGALSQLVGLIIPTIMGGVTGFVYGAVTDAASVVSFVADYRTKFGPGSTANGGGIL